MKKQKIQRRAFLKNATVLTGASLAIPSALVSCDSDTNTPNVISYGQGDGFYKKQIGKGENYLVKNGNSIFHNKALLLLISLTDFIAQLSRLEFDILIHAFSEDH